MVASKDSNCVDGALYLAKDLVVYRDRIVSTAGVTPTKLLRRILFMCGLTAVGDWYEEDGKFVRRVEFRRATGR